MPIGTASNRPGSSASITERAETTDTSCSADRPPKRIAIRRLPGVTSGPLQRPGEVLDHVVGLLEADAHPDQPVADPGDAADLRVHLPVSRRRRVADQRLVPA